MVIDPGYFFDRIGTDREQPKDRHFCYELSKRLLNHQWKEAMAANDYNALETIDRNFRFLEAL